MSTKRGELEVNGSDLVDALEGSPPEYVLIFILIELRRIADALERAK